MNFIFLSYFPAITGLVLLAGVALVNNPRNRVNRLFSLFVFSVAGWLFALYCADSAQSHTVALWSLRTAMLLGSVVGFSFLLLSDSFPNAERRNLGPKVSGALLAMTLVFMILAMTDLMSGGIKRTQTSTTLDSLTVVYSLQTLSLFAQIVLGIVFVLRRRKHASPIQKMQIWLFVLGMTSAIIIGSIPGVVFIALDVESRATAALTGASFFVFALCVWTAIARHRLFNVRSLVARTVAYFSALLIVATLYAFLVGMVIERLMQTKTVEVVLTGMSALIAMVLFKFVRSWFDRVTNRLFYHEAYSSRERLDKLTGQLVEHVELEELAQKSLKSIQETLKPQTATLIIVGGKSDYQYGNNVVTLSAAFKKSIKDTDDIIYEMYDDDQSLRRLHVQIPGVDLFVVVRSATKTEGYLLLGPRSSGEVYSRQDINYLKIAARNIGLALHSAKSFQEINDFNKTLKKKVALATKELRQKNEQLLRLHKTKDDFISMASHQLRPKITAAVGFLDLVEDTKPRYTREQQELVGLAKQGMKQMNEVITDMLDISRMDDDKITINASGSNIWKLVSEEVTRANKTAKSKRVRLVSVQTNSSQDATFDIVKIREVVQILIENALQYSAGEVLVEIRLKTNNMISVMVHDKGIGLSKLEQKRLFEKFYRSDSAKRIRPMGSGIGLYAARMIIEAHGGNMLIMSQKGKGSSIGFEIPR